MKLTSRDNLIYIAVGLGIAALVAGDFFYADSQGREMWLPSTFAFRLVGSTGILAYYVGREIRKAEATLVETIACVLLGSLVHLIMGFEFRSEIGRLGTVYFSSLVALEALLIVVLLVLGLKFFRSGKAGM